jgi:hypothetical protein
VAGTALAAFLFAVTYPALAAMHRMVDPLAFAAVCSSRPGAAAHEPEPAAPGFPQGKLKAAHCLMCLGAGSPPPARGLAPVIVAAVPERLVPVDRGTPAARDPAELHPLNPRAPPHV